MASMAGVFSNKKKKQLFSEFSSGLKKNISTIHKYDVNFQYEEYLKKPEVEEQPKLYEIEVKDFYGGEYLSERAYQPRSGYGRRSGVQITTNDILKPALNSTQQESSPAGFESRPEEFLHATTVGSAGSGKTTLLKRFARDAMFGKIPQINDENQIVHMMNCRNFNKDDKITVPDFMFLNMFHKPSNEAIKFGYEWMLQNSDKVILVVDSLDTLTYELDDESTVIKPHDTSSPGTILYNILTARLFPKVRILSSSREYKIRKYKEPLRADRIISLGGLAQESIRNLVYGFLDEKEAIRVWQILETQCPDLMTLCETPVCLIFTLIGLVEKNSKSFFTPTTMSGIMIKVLEALIHSEHARAFGRHDENYVITAINKMKELSFRGIMEGRVLFKEEDLKRAQLTTGEITDLAIVVPGNTDQHQQILDGKDVVEFCHQILQEILAALFLLKMTPDEFRSFAKTHLHKDIFSVARRFLCGVSLNPEVRKAASVHLIQETADTEDISKILISSMTGRFMDQSKHGKDLLEIIRAIHESGEVSKYIVPANVKKIRFSFTRMLPSDMVALASTIFYSDRVNSLELFHCNLTPEALRLFSNKLMHSAVQMDLLYVTGNHNMEVEGLETMGQLAQKHGVRSLLLQNCCLTAELLRALDRGLDDAKVELLDVYMNDQLGVEGMKVLAETVTKHEVRILGISACKLKTEHGIAFRNTVGNYKIKRLENKRTVWDDPQVSAICELLPVVSECVDMTRHELTDDDQKLLQDKLDQLPSTDLTIVFGKYEPFVTLKARSNAEVKQSETQDTDKGNGERSQNEVEILDPETETTETMQIPNEGNEVYESTGESQGTVKGNGERSQDEVEIVDPDTETTETMQIPKEGNEVYESTVRDIPPTGVTVRIGRCEVEFPPRAVTKKTKLPFSVRGVNSQQWPSQYIGISPALTIDYDSEFLAPVAVRLITWCVSTGSGNPVVSVMRWLPDGSWEEVATHPLNRNRVIEFKTTRFSPVMAFINKIWYKWIRFPVRGSVYADGRYFRVGIHCDDANLESATRTRLIDMGGQCKLQLNVFYIKYDDEIGFQFVLPPPEGNEINFYPPIETVSGNRLVGYESVICSFKILPPRDREFLSLRDVTLNISKNGEALDEGDQYDFDYEWQQREKRPGGASVASLNSGDSSRTTIQGNANISIHHHGQNPQGADQNPQAPENPQEAQQNPAGAPQIPQGAPHNPQ